MDGWQQAREVAGRQDGVLTRQAALAAGLSAGAWRRGQGTRLVPLLPGVVFVGGLRGLPDEPGPRQRARAALLVAGPGARLCQGSVLRLAGVAGTPRGDPEHVLLPDVRWHQRTGVRRHWYAVPPEHLGLLAGLPATSVVRACHDAVRREDRGTAVSILDSARHLGLLPDPGPLADRPLPASRRAGWH